MVEPKRFVRRSALAAKLSAQSDGDVLKLLAAGTQRRTGIGGDTQSIEFDG